MITPSDEQVKAYKDMVSESTDTMEVCIMRHLEANCQKYKGHEDRFANCIEYVTECAAKILDNKNGEVPDEVCYRIAMDYFDDEIWKKEDEEAAKERAEAERRKNEARARKSRQPQKTARPATISASIDDAVKESDTDESEDEEKTFVPPVTVKPKPKDNGQMDLFASLGI